MNKGPSSALTLFALLILTSQILAQDFSTNGAVIFVNRNLQYPNTEQNYHAPISLPDGRLAEGPSFTAGLFLVQAQGLDLLATTPLEPGAGAGYFRARAIEIPNHPPGSSATFRVRVWDTAAGSYDDAVRLGRYHGEFLNEAGSPLIHVPLLSGINSPGPFAPPKLDGMQPLTLIPEPDTIALTILGALMLAGVAMFPRTVMSC